MNIEINKVKDVTQAPMALLLTADPSKKIVKDFLDRGTCYIALLECEIVGVFVLLRTHPETVELVNIAVEKERQGQGIGKKLVLAALEIAKGLQIKTIEIGTGNSSINQLALYQKCGFRITGVDHDFFVLHYNEEIYENGIQCRDMIRLSKDLENSQ